MNQKALIFISFLAATFIPTASFGEDAVIADPKHYTVEFENDKVRIIRIKYGPGEKFSNAYSRPKCCSFSDGESYSHDIA